MATGEIRGLMVRDALRAPHHEGRERRQVSKGEENMKLTPQQVEYFHREGWLFLPELFTPEEVALLAREALNIYDTQRPEVWREKSGAPRTAFAAHLYNEAFGILGAHPRMINP